ncbi:hypothetical protein [Natrinema salaciae]|uniref:Zinc-ribbon domain-containing protein n=1 Tax=Natrinema salaciae TaxID=1186196 RepID=A0A1H9AEV0_9EURY|nr:hypothetical protein [Natrinema salaciae]SEP75017.1 hypothetical protein SAMN04489841_0428 [Natrinema salaciae]
MSVLDELIDRIGIPREPADRSSVHYECRRCGTTLSKRDASCPRCGSADVAAIPL